MFRNKFDAWLLFDKDGDSGNGSGGNDGGRDAAFQRLLDRYKNDGIAVADKLFGENYTYRQRISQLEQQVTDLQGKVPGQGTVVLSSDEAIAWEAYKALGKPEEVKQGLDQKAQLQGQLAAKQREDVIRGVAETAGYKPSVLAQLDAMAKAAGKDLAFELRDQTQDGQVVKVAFVKDGATEEPLADYAIAQWSDFLPALSSEQPQGGNQQQQSGTRFVTQHTGSGQSSKTDPVSTFLQEREQQRAAVKNPLLKQ